MLIMAGLLHRALPQHRGGGTRTGYADLLGSTMHLFIEEPVLRVRALFALLIFATFSTFWTAIVLPLSAPPFSLSHTVIGLLGLGGLVGALAAGGAGRLADRGWGNRTTGVALVLMLVAWIPIALLPVSLWWLIAGVLILDLAIQAVHVSSQSMILAARPDAGSRLIGAYMVFYSVGSACGAIATTMVYARLGWVGVCALGGGISMLTLLLWCVITMPGTLAPTGNRRCRDRDPSYRKPG